MTNNLPTPAIKITASDVVSPFMASELAETFLTGVHHDNLRFVTTLAKAHHRTPGHVIDRILQFVRDLHLEMVDGELPQITLPEELTPDGSAS